MAEALFIRPKSSPILLSIVALLGLLLFSALLLADLSLLHRLLLIPTVAIAWLHLLFSHALRRGPFAVTAVEWLGEGRWRLTDGRGRRHEVARRPGAVIHHRWLALPFGVAWRRYTLLLAPDALDRESRRALRVRVLADPG